jgi:tetratricopeptide (TPR) repeat protein
VSGRRSLGLEAGEPAPNPGAALVATVRARRLRFDGAPLVSVLGGAPPAHGAPASAFVHVDALVEEIGEAVASRRLRVAVGRMRALLVDQRPVPLWACRYCAAVIAPLVPNVPLPLLGRGVATAGPMLEALFERVGRYPAPVLLWQVGTLLYRFQEGRGRYDRARVVIDRLLERARGEGDQRVTAVLMNNHAYEHLLAREWEAAEALFERALSLFERVGASHELPNVHANLLECRFARLAPDRWGEMVPRLTWANRALVGRGDWRARKTLRLLARLAESRGRRRAALGWARRAVTASGEAPTRLREADRAYLRSLRQDSPAAAAR